MQYIGSTTPLQSGSSFVSPWTLTDYSTAIGGSAFADQAGTIYVDQSSDGVDVDITNSFNVTASAVGQGFTQPLVLPYYRIRFANTGSAAQTVLRLATRLTPGAQP